LLIMVALLEATVAIGSPSVTSSRYPKARLLANDVSSDCMPKQNSSGPMGRHVAYPLSSQPLVIRISILILAVMQ